LEHMAKHRVSQLRFEPGAFRRHNSTRVGDRHKVFNAGWEHRKGAGVFAVVDQFLQLTHAANAADKIQSLAGARVIDAENRVQDIFLKQSYIEFFDRVGGGGEPWAEMQRVPLALKVEPEFVLPGWC